MNDNGENNNSNLLEDSLIALFRALPLTVKIIVITVAILLLILMIVFIVIGISIEDDSSSSDSATAQVNTTGTGYWWPIGSDEITTQNGVEFASGDPANTNVTSGFGGRSIAGSPKMHQGVDLQGTLGVTNVIASISGTVTKVNNTCPSIGTYGSSCGGGFGNYVMVQDSKGNTEVYGHLYQGSLRVKANDTVTQGQLLGKVGSSGSSTGAHLHFGIEVNGTYVNPLDYISATNPRGTTGDGLIPWDKTTYSETEFSSKVLTYFSSSDHCSSNHCRSFYSELKNGGTTTIYNIAKSKNINPEIYIARAMGEGYSPGKGHNYVGYGCPNGASNCTSFGSFNDAVQKFFDNISKYSSAKDMMSSYAYIGKYWYNPGGWGLGGCKYYDSIKQYMSASRANEVGKICSGAKCPKGGGAGCVKTNDEDQDAYSTYLATKMATDRGYVFG